MEDTKRVARRRHDAELKTLVLEQCSQPGASVARIALSHDLNANLVHKWRRESRNEAIAPIAAKTEFIPVQLAAPSPALRQEARIELRRGAIAVKGQCRPWSSSRHSDCSW